METTEVDENSARKTLLDDAALLFDKLMQGLSSAEDICKNTMMLKIDHVLQEQKELLKSSRTAALWLQYMEMVDILCKFV